MKIRPFSLVLIMLPCIATATERPRLSTDGSAETVYNWSKDRCDDLFIPDSPARAYRLREGNLMLVAAHYSNEVIRGTSFDDLNPDCLGKSNGKENSDPSKFDDRYWIQALLAAPNSRIFALVSHEYMGKRHPGACQSSSKPGPQCWYSSIALAQASEDELHFDLVAGPERVVAAPPVRYDPNAQTRVGFFTATNVVHKGDWSYFLSWVEAPGMRGNCLFRAPSSSPSGPWLALANGEFTQRFDSPYNSINANRHCDTVGKNQLKGSVRSVIWLDNYKVFVAVFAVQAAPQEESGVYYSFSDDLVSWSEPALLYRIRIWWGTMDCSTFFDYPSLIDHDGTADFSTGGSNLYLYLTRLNWQDCNRGLNRDLVRIHVNVGAR